MTAFINGVRIDSTKGIQAIINSLIVFGDGSTYNTTTGEFSGDDPSGIVIDGKPLAADDSAPTKATPPAMQSRDFKASVLHLRLNQTYKVVIERHETAGMHAELHGAAATNKTLTLTEDGERLTVADAPDFSGSGMSIIGSGNVTISGGNVSISGVRGGSINNNNGASSGTIKLFVPARTPIHATITSADVTIGDVDGPLIFLITGSGKVHASSVSEKLEAMIIGSGKVKVDSGSVQRLYADITGSGNVRFRGVAEQATLIVDGSGDIEVDHVIQRPHESRTGSGDITVMQIG